MYPEFTYASFGNHFINLGRYALAFLLIYVYVPRKIFSRNSDSTLENLFSGFMKMTFFVMLMGYFLVLIKIFEAITLIAVFVLLAYIHYARNEAISSVSDVLSKVQMDVFDYLDGIKNPVHQIKEKIFRKNQFSGGNILSRIKDPEFIAVGILIILIFGYSAYLRFLDPFINAALPMADSYTVLSWTKHLGRNILFFPDGGGIYPRGMDFYFEVIQKFSFIDHLYVLKYSGALNPLLTVFGIYFALSRFLGNAFPGMMAATVYGVFGPFIRGDFERQASPNSQELAFIFVLPTLYFLYKYFCFKRKDDFWTAFCGLAAAGLIHQLVFAYMGLGMGLLILYAMMKGLNKNWNAVWKISLAGIVSVVVSLLPFIIGFLLNAPVHSSSMEFLMSQVSDIKYPKLNFADYLSISGAFLLVLALLFTGRKVKNLRGDFPLFLLVAATFCLYYLGTYTKSMVIVSRIGEFWGLMQAVAIGLGAFGLVAFIDRLGKRSFILTVSCIVILSVMIIRMNPVQATPYKMERNVDTEQYLRITKHFTSGTWMVFSTWHKYALVLGKGNHGYMENLLKFDPVTLEYHADNGEAKWEWSNLQQNIFIYQPKNIYRVDPAYVDVYKLEEGQTYNKEEREKPLLEEWIKVYRLNHNDLSVFYEDDDLRVLYIKKLDEDEKEKNWKKLWGYKGGVLDDKCYQYAGIAG